MKNTYLQSILICMVIAFAAPAIAQRNSSTRVPRVGMIKDYPATGLTYGCGNLYFTLKGGKGDGSDYVFLSRGDGSHAWMNLNGRDTQLRLLRQETRFTDAETIIDTRYSYRVGTTRIDSLIRRNLMDDDATSMLMTITLTRGRASRVIRAVGSSDC